MNRKPNKYRNHPIEVDGIRFDSKAEARRYGELKILERAGEIGGLRLQPRFPIEVNGMRVCTYIADFEYRNADGRVVEDVKGKPTPVYNLKKRLIRAVHGIEIQEIR